MSDELTKKDLREYYEKHFDVEQMLRVVIDLPFHRREFGFELREGVFIRNRSFPNVEEFQQFLIDEAPSAVYIGAIYEGAVAKDRTIRDVAWEGHELVFDFDADEYAVLYINPRGCKGAQICTICWSLMQDAALFIEETLRKDFGLTDLIWTFSGRRGIHCWVKDDVVIPLDQNQRNSIIGYLTLIHDPKGEQRVELPSDYARPLYERIYSIIGTSFLKHTTIEDLKELGLTKREAGVILERVSQIERRFTPREILSLISLEHEKKFIEQSILMRAPRIDHKVTIDIRRLLRCPGSIHGKAGKPCIIIEGNISDFYPDDVPTLKEILQK